MERKFFRVCACEKSTSHFDWPIDPRGANHWTKNKNGDRVFPPSKRHRGVDKPDFHGLLIKSPQNSKSEWCFHYKYFERKFLSTAIISLRERERERRRGSKREEARWFSSLAVWESRRWFDNNRGRKDERRGAAQPKHFRHNEVREEMCHRRITLVGCRLSSARDKLLFLNIYFCCVSLLCFDIYTGRRMQCAAFFND
jgi:hypothetical protein